MLPDGYGAGRGESDAERADLAELHGLTRSRAPQIRPSYCERHGPHISVPGVGCLDCENEAAEYARRNAWHRNDDWKESKL